LKLAKVYFYMMEKGWHLAQINVAKIIGESISDPVMKKFVDQLEEVNALAEGSPGFIWRLKDDTNNATSLNPYNDQTIIINMSVWESLEHLIKFVYKGRHAEVLRKRREWFVDFGKPFTTLWYIPAGHVPTVEEAMERLRSLQENGPTPFAFDFKTKFPAPSMATNPMKP
jgi:heme-degrading monooxygenase HmoA